MRIRPLLAGLAALVAPALAFAQFDDVVIESTALTPSIHVLEGRGGNMAVCVGDDGVFLIDDQFAPLTAKIKAAIAEIHEGEVRFVINTHWHGDHTGGNENFGDTGSLIVAHDNVRARMSVENIGKISGRTTPPSPDGALPVVTFNDEITFHLNGETIHAFHVENAHTDGDAIIHFVDADVIHMGDVLFNGLFPYIDVDSGGSIDGVIAAVDRVLELAGEDTRIIAGHGPLADVAALHTYRAMLVDVRARVMALVEQGMDLDGALAAKPTAPYDEDWNWSFIDGERLTTLVFSDLAGRAASDD